MKLICTPSGRAPAFTLLELLIVVAIIAILAAIAIPNFLEAQTRAKAARAKADLRTIGQALEAYAIDYKNYPFPRAPYKESISTVHELSTPVAYLASVAMLDAFNPKVEDLNPPPPPAYRPTYWYDSYSGAFGREMRNTHPESNFSLFRGYCISSVGPNRMPDAVALMPLYMEWKPKSERACLDFVYDPSNGAVSPGDIPRWTGKPQKYGVW